MAFKLTDEQINGLLGKGFISTEFADSIANKKGSEQSKAIVQQAKDADEELKAIPIQDDMVVSKTAGDYNTNPGDIKEPVAPHLQGMGELTLPQQQALPPAQPGEIGPPTPPRPSSLGTHTGGQGSSGPHTLEETIAATNVNPGNPQAPGQGGPVAPHLSAMAAANPGMMNVPNPNAPPPVAPAAPRPAGPVGPGGVHLPKSEQMALAQAREAGAVDSILQGRTNDIAIRQAEQSAAALDQGLADQQAAYDKYQANRQERYDASLAELSELKKRSDEIANTKIDPDAHWSHGLFGSNTTANKIVAGIGVLLGGFGQGAARNGGDKKASNMGLNALNKTIDDDIDAQKTNLANRSGQLKQRESLYARNLEIYKDADLADLATARQYWEKAGQQVQVISAKSGSEKAKVEADKAMLGIGQRVAALDVQEQARKEQIARVQAANAYAKSDAARFESALKSNPVLKNLPREQAFQIWKKGSANEYEADIKVAGTAGKGPSEAENKAATADADVLRALDVLDSIPNDAVLSPAQAKAAQEAQEAVRVGLSVAGGQGTRTGPDRDAEQSLAGGVGAWTGSNKAARDAIRAQVQGRQARRSGAPAVPKPKEQ